MTKNRQVIWNRAGLEHESPLSRKRAMHGPVSAAADVAAFKLARERAEAAQKPAAPPSLEIGAVHCGADAVAAFKAGACMVAVRDPFMRCENGGYLIWSDIANAWALASPRFTDEQIANGTAWRVVVAPDRRAKAEQPVQDVAVEHAIGSGAWAVQMLRAGNWLRIRDETHVWRLRPATENTLEFLRDGERTWHPAPLVWSTVETLADHYSGTWSLVEKPEQAKPQPRTATFKVGDRVRYKRIGDHVGIVTNADSSTRVAVRMDDCSAAGTYDTDELEHAGDWAWLQTLQHDTLVMRGNDVIPEKASVVLEGEIGNDRVATDWRLA